MQLEPNDSPQDLISYCDAARLLCVPRGTLYAWVHTKSIPHVRLGPRLVRFSRASLFAWVAERTVVGEENNGCHR